MVEDIEVDYNGERYFCGSIEDNKCSEGTQIEIKNPPELIFLDSLIREIKKFIHTKISKDIEVSLFTIPENTQLAIVARPQTITGLGTDEQQVFSVSFDVICSTSELALNGGTTYAVAVLAMALTHAKYLLSFQYSYSLSFSGTPEDITVSVSIRKKIV